MELGALACSEKCGAAVCSKPICSDTAGREQIVKRVLQLSGNRTICFIPGSNPRHLSGVESTEGALREERRAS